MDTLTIWLDDCGNGYAEADALDAYNEILDEVYGTVTVAGMEYETSRVLAEIDPIAYRCGFSDYVSEWREVEMPWELYVLGWDDETVIKWIESHG